MIARLRGVFAESAGDRIVVDCSGVGYLVQVSGFTMAGLPDEGDTVLLRVFHHVNPQDMRTSLFGFGSSEERELFDLLITVKKVGPTAAMGILSGGMRPQDLARIIAESDTKALVKLKGVGKKTAEMVVVELREKCEAMLVRWGMAGADIGSPIISVGSRPPILDDVVQALAQMGFRQGQVDTAVDALKVTASDTIETLLRRALQSMPR